MSFIFAKPPKMPDPPQFIQPKVEDVPSFEDEERKKEANLKLRRQMANRTGRSSTILTGSGLTQNPDIDQKTLLGV